MIDEFHASFREIRWILRKWPDAAVLGLSGTFDEDKVRVVALSIGWDPALLEAATVRIPENAIKGAFPRVEVNVTMVSMSSLEMACYEAGREWMSATEKQRLLIFPPNREEAVGADSYGAELW